MLLTSGYISTKLLCIGAASLGIVVVVTIVGVAVVVVAGVLVGSGGHCSSLISFWTCPTVTVLSVDLHELCLPMWHAMNIHLLTEMNTSRHYLLLPLGIRGHDRPGTAGGRTSTGLL